GRKPGVLFLKRFRVMDILLRPEFRSWRVLRNATIGRNARKIAPSNPADRSRGPDLESKIPGTLHRECNRQPDGCMLVTLPIIARIRRGMREPHVSLCIVSRL